VLVVDDEPEIAASMRDLLRRYGYVVRTAPDGPAAVAAATADRPDVVLLDLAMPGMDGWQLAENLRELPGERRPLLVAVSAYASDADRRRSDEAGINLHLSKPAEPAVLAAILDRFAKVIGTDGGAAQP
jgi:CheY-like chemotaxis protein